MPYKTQICRNWEVGKCTKAETCSFAHGAEEIVRPVQDGFFKTALCKYFEDGNCSRGDACTFAHGEKELREIDTVKASAGRKSIMCKYWQSGGCHKGEECPYAHGEEDLRPRTRSAKEASPAFKTHLCKYHEAGNCSKGDSCNYAHGPEELADQLGGKARAVQDGVRDTGHVVARGPEEPSSRTGDLTPASLTHAVALSTASTACVIQPKQVLPPSATKRQLESQSFSSVKRQQVHDPRPICAFFKVGRCAKGLDCPYLHVDDTQDLPNVVTAAPVVGRKVCAVVPKVVPPKPKSTVVPPDAVLSPTPTPTDPYGNSAYYFKRTICKFWLSNCCANGENCTFAHGDHELQQTTEGTAAWTFIPDASGEIKNRPYKLDEARFCRKEDACDFAPDGLEEPVRLDVTVRGSTVYATAALKQEPVLPVRAALPFREYRPGHYKTQMCRFFQEGTCPRGDACTFAHDESELPPLVGEEDVIGQEDTGYGQPAETHVYFKTRVCKYYLQGSCPKGDACNYAHGDAELQAPGWVEGTNGNSWGIVVPSLVAATQPPAA
mmetsp:Transcript_60447/g.141370  ORF Transcript_60447/g.141370 Transcript_60447/m.141370 type:complete len:551 (-) Transcript_60447:5-1657(-)